jgi:3-keto-disaccharide hydrolase
MSGTGRYNTNHFVFSVLIGLFILTGCSEKKTPAKKVSEDIVHPRDSTSLFDGKTLEGWEITNFGPQGPVYVSGNAIILGMGDGCTGITWKKAFPRTGYEVTLDAERVAGNDFFCGMTFPVGKDPCTLIIGGWGGATVGLSNIDGRDAAENETTKIRNFDNNRWYHMRLEVTDEYIKSWIDSEKVVDFTIDSKKLSIRPEVELSRPFGIASWNTTAAIRNIHLYRTEK